MHIRNALVATASLAAMVCGSAYAADLPNRKSAEAPYLQPVPVFTWAGLYAGLNAGVAFNNGGGGSRTGFTGGGQIGYNFQSGSFVYGLETDIQYRDGRRNGFGSSSNYFGTVRARVGYAIDRTLIYATGGFAYGGGAGSQTVVVNNGGGNNFYTGGSSSTRSGYTLGGGVEYALTPNWTIKGEYLYVDLGRNNRNLTPTGPVFVGNPAFVASNTSDRFSVIRAGLNYKF